MGPEHPNVGKVLQYFAELHQAQGKYPEAESLYKRSLAIRKKALGRDHLDVAKSLESYADLLHKTGRGKEAGIMEGRAKAIRAKHDEQNPVK